MPLGSVQGHIAAGEIWNVGSLVGLLRLLTVDGQAVSHGARSSRIVTLPPRTLYSIRSWWSARSETRCSHQRAISRR